MSPGAEADRSLETPPSLLPRGRLGLPFQSEPRSFDGGPPTAGAWPSLGAAARLLLGLLRGPLLGWWRSDFWAGAWLTFGPRRGPWLGWCSDHRGGCSWLALGPLRGRCAAAGSGLLAGAADPVLLFLLVEAATFTDAVLAVHDLAFGIEEGERRAAMYAEVLGELLVLGESGALLNHFLTHLTVFSSVHIW